ncbi:MAG: hypothetical protein WCE21_04100 [Candidatus Babeliales bacterium]
MKKLLLLLLSATTCAIMHAGEFRNYKEYLPLVAPQNKQQQQETNFYFTENGQGLKKELAEMINISLASEVIPALTVIAHCTQDAQKPLLSLPTITSGLLTYYAIGRLLVTFQGLGHIVAHKILLPNVRIKSFYVSALPLDGVHATPNGDDIARELKKSDQIFAKEKRTTTEEIEALSEIKRIALAQAGIELAGPLTRMAASLGCLYASSYCSNDNIRFAANATATAHLIRSSYNIIANDKAHKLLDRIEEIEKHEELIRKSQTW